MAGLFLKLPAGKVGLNALVSGKGEIEIVENGSGVNMYNKGEEIVLRAKASEGSIFKGWSGDVESEAKTINLTLDSSKSLVANFDSGFVLNLAAENGRIIKSPNLETYSNGDKVVLQAVPDKGFGFIEWTGDVLGSEKLVEITMNKDFSVNAFFGKAFSI